MPIARSVAATLLVAGLLSPLVRAEPVPAGAGGGETRGEAEVVVRGDRQQVPASSRDPTAASTVVAAEELKQPGATSADVLARVPGVQVAQTGADADLATAAIRGASSSQTPVYLAGVRINDDVTGTADLSTIPLWMMHRAEVFRGNAPLGADRLGLGGAVFFEPRLPRRHEAAAGIGAGSFGARSAWLALSAAAADSSAMLALRRDVADNDYPFVHDNGTRAVTADDRELRRSNAEHGATDAWVIGRHRLGPGVSP